MLILVKNLYGRTVSVKVESTSDTVASVKAKLEELEGIPPQHHDLLYSGRILRDGHKLSDHNVVEESTLYLLVRRISCGGGCCSSDDDSIYIYVQTRTSKTLALQVDPSSDTITDVRRKISGHHQSLFLAGNKLKDNRTFGSYHQIQNDTTLPCTSTSACRSFIKNPGNIDEAMLFLSFFFFF
jgi:ubiquitin C